MAEAVLWSELKDRKLGGHGFVRQFPIGRYFADVLCRRTRLVVAVAGSQHAESSYDRRRDEYMRLQGYSVIRFWSSDVLKELEAVRQTILAALDREFRRDVVAPDLRYVAADREVTPHRLASLATSRQRREETRKVRGT